MERKERRNEGARVGDKCFICGKPLVQLRSDTVYVFLGCNDCRVITGSFVEKRKGERRKPKPEGGDISEVGKGSSPASTNNDEEAS